MAIRYTFYTNSGHFSKEAQSHARVISSGTRAPRQIEQLISEATTLTPADVKGALTALSGIVRDALLNGENVHLEGLGYFSILMDGEIYKDKEERLRMKNPHVRTVAFRPEQSLKDELSQAQFSLMRNKGHRSKTLTDEEVRAVIDQLAFMGQDFSVRDFCAASGLTFSTSLRRLKKLFDQGQLVRQRRGSMYFYRLP